LGKTEEGARKDVPKGPKSPRGNKKKRQKPRENQKKKKKGVKGWPNRPKLSTTVDQTRGGCLGGCFGKRKDKLFAKSPPT